MHTAHVHTKLTEFHLFILIPFIYVYVCVHVHVLCVCVYPCACAQGGERHPIALELEVQAVVSCLMWVLGIELGSSGSTVHS